jgi:glucose/arabinose dehydrogenase
MSPRPRATFSILSPRGHATSGTPRLGRAAAICALAALAGFGAQAAGCAPATPPASSANQSQSAPPAASPPAPAASAGASATPPASLDHLQITLVARWSGFSAPVDIVSARDGSGRLFVVEQAGRIRVIRDGKVVSRPYLDITRSVTFGGERGLLGLAFSPGFKTNGRFYVDYVDTSGNTVIAQGTATDPASDSPSIGSLRTILHIRQPPYPNHKGGELQFGHDGYLYIGMGDGGSAGDPGDRAQNPRVLLGKMLRIDPEHASGQARYAIPPGQPVRPGWAPEVFAIGLRNPWRFSFDASTGALWIGDVGQDAWEEVDVASAGTGGQNWGWNRWEGLHAYPRGSTRSRASYAFPVYDYPHPDGESITGGYVYRGSKYPALVGTYLYADFVKGWLAGLRTTAPNGTPLAKAQSRRLLGDVGQPSSFGADEVGELYVVDYRGSILSVTAARR